MANVDEDLDAGPRTVLLSRRALAAQRTVSRREISRVSKSAFEHPLLIGPKRAPRRSNPRKHRPQKSKSAIGGEKFGASDVSCSGESWFNSSRRRRNALNLRICGQRGSKKETSARREQGRSRGHDPHDCCRRLEWGGPRAALRTLRDPAGDVLPKIRATVLGSADQDATKRWMLLRPPAFAHAAARATKLPGKEIARGPP